jgi:hypothetical protein
MPPTDANQGFLNIQGLQSLINDLTLALDWLSGHGIERNQTRFGNYEKTLKRVLEHRAAGTEDLLPNLVTASEYGYAFIETVDLTNIHRALGGRKNQAFLEKVRRHVLLVDRCLTKGTMNRATGEGARS